MSNSSRNINRADTPVHLFCPDSPRCMSKNMSYRVDACGCNESQSARRRSPCSYHAAEHSGRAELFRHIVRTCGSTQRKPRLGDPSAMTQGGRWVLFVGRQLTSGTRRSSCGRIEAQRLFEVWVSCEWIREPGFHWSAASRLPRGHDGWLQPFYGRRSESFAVPGIAGPLRTA